MNNKTKNLTIMGLMSGILLVMGFTPLGYLNIGPLAITFNAIPLAISAMAMGKKGGILAGSIFGLTSFCQAVGIGGVSPLGSILFNVSPIYSVILCFVPRILDGLIVGLVFEKMNKSKTGIRCTTAGLLAALLNTIFFMSALVILFGNTEYISNMINGRNIIVFICATVGFNAVFEMLASAIISGAVGSALVKAKLIGN